MSRRSCVWFLTAHTRKYNHQIMFCWNNTEPACFSIIGGKNRENIHVSGCEHNVFGNVQVLGKENVGNGRTFFEFLSISRMFIVLLLPSNYLHKLHTCCKFMSPSSPPYIYINKCVQIIFCKPIIRTFFCAHQHVINRKLC